MKQKSSEKSSEASNKYMLKPFADRPQEKMKEVLMHPDAPGPDVHYYMIRGGVDKTNITVWETGTVGGEYIKTYGHYHVGNLNETYTILQGEGIVLLQTRKRTATGVPTDDEIETFRAVHVTKGNSIFIPSETGHLVANIGKNWLVTSDDSPVNFEEKDPVSLPGHADYEAVKKMRGFGYYLVEQEGKPILIKNILYRAVPDAKIETFEEYSKKPLK